MVRKRTRKYESDDNDSDSDVDFDFETQSRPAAKKYSLRERKRAPLFTTDFDYYGLDDEDGEAKKQSSDDEDFHVEKGADVNEEASRTFYEPDPDANPQNSEGLIDFEDIIRADIVVNKNKIDYDNLIQKTEIKLTQPKRRGRKPKNSYGGDVKEEEEETKFVCEPDLASLSQIEKPEVEECEKKEDGEQNEKEKELPNGDILETLENGVVDDDSLFLKDSIEMVMLQPPPILEERKIEDEDDDVIVLGELKPDVIVLDD